MTASAEFLGAAEAMADLREWADQLGPALVHASSPLADRLASTASSRVPHLSGQLAASIRTSNANEGELVGVAFGYSGSVPYDGWIEFGGTRGRPYVSDGRYIYPTAQEAESDPAAADARTAAPGAAWRWTLEHERRARRAGGRRARARRGASCSARAHPHHAAGGAAHPVARHAARPEGADRPLLRRALRPGRRRRRPSQTPWMKLRKDRPGLLRDDCEDERSRGGRRARTLRPLASESSPASAASGD